MTPADTQTREKSSRPSARGLGRGLNALFEDEESVFPASQPTGAKISAPPAASSSASDTSARKVLSVGVLVPGALQPRQEFAEGPLAELADSIKEHGILQPLLVRPHPKEDGLYEIIAGERRWRAAQRAQLHEVPVVIRAMNDAQALEIGLIENLQRADLNPVEEALAYKRLMDEFGHTQEKLAQHLGKSRSYIANMVRLLSLPALPLEALKMGDLSIGHARVLVAAERPEQLAITILENGLNVRQAEALARGEKVAKRNVLKQRRQGASKDVNIQDLEKRLSNALGLRSEIIHKKNGAGEVRITYNNLGQLDEVLKRLMLA